MTLYDTAEGNILETCLMDLLLLVLNIVLNIFIHTSIHPWGRHSNLIKSSVGLNKDGLHYEFVKMEPSLSLTEFKTC